MEEISRDNRLELEKRYRSTALIVAAQIMFSIVLIIFAWFSLGNSESAKAIETLMPLWIVILFVAVGSFFLRRMLFKWERLKEITLLKGTGGLFSALQKNSIILGAMAEAVAVIGFIVAVISGNKSDMLRAGAVALIVFFINFPRKSVWEKIVAGMEKV